jgi:hypothetical protein
MFIEHSAAEATSWQSISKSGPQMCYLGHKKTFPSPFYQHEKNWKACARTHTHTHTHTNDSDFSSKVRCLDNSRFTLPWYNNPQKHPTAAPFKRTSSSFCQFFPTNTHTQTERECVLHSTGRHTFNKPRPPPTSSYLGLWSGDFGTLRKHFLKQSFCGFSSFYKED